MAFASRSVGQRGRERENQREKEDLDVYVHICISLWADGVTSCASMSINMEGPKIGLNKPFLHDVGSTADISEGATWGLLN
jgi:hypothetical protein